MKKLMALAALMPLLACAKSSTPAGFTDDLDAAFARAKENGKYVYACFSGSDWCGWCIKLEQEVFSKPAFLDGVTNDYELVYIDMPRDKSVLSEHAKAVNEGLVKQYKVRGFPTALILTAAGETIEQTGYRAGGPEAYAAYLKEVRADGPNRAAKKAANEAYLAPFEKRQTEIVNGVHAELMAAQKKIVGEAAVKIAALIADVEKSEAPEGVAAARAEFLEDLKGMHKKMTAARDGSEDEGDDDE